MTWQLLVTGTGCALVALLTVTACAAIVLRQLKDRPTPLRELVEALQVRVTGIETEQERLLQLIRRDNARVAKERQRTRQEPEEVPAEPGEEVIVPPKGQNGQQLNDFERMFGPPPPVRR